MSKTSNQQLLGLCTLSFKEGNGFPKFAALKEPASQEILRLLKLYDYTRSREFAEKVQGKSDEYVRRYAISVSEPVKGAELREKFFAAVSNIESSAAVLAFLPPEAGDAILEKIRRLLAGRYSS